MVIDQIKQIDQNADNQIDGKELVDALKPNGFFSKEHNLIKLWNLLNSKDIGQLDQGLFSSLEDSFYSLKNQILQKEDITDEDEYMLNVYIKVLWWKCEEESREIQKVINWYNVQKIMWKNFVSAEDICTLQDYMSKLDGDQEKISEIQDFIEWNDVQKIMQECRNKGNISEYEQEKINAYMDKLWLNNDATQTSEQVQRLDEIQKFLSRQREVIDKIYNVYNTLNQNSQKLLSDLLWLWTNVDLVSKIDSFLSWDVKLDTENEIKWVNVLNKLIEQDEYRHSKLENIVNKNTIEMSHDVNKKIAKNTKWNANYYNKTEIMLVQLWSNVCYWENLTINWIRWEEIYRPMKDISSKEWITSTYIYRLELMTRSDIIMIRHKNINTRVDNLLDIPNLHDMLDVVQPKEKQEEIRQDFLDTVYLPIRQWWIYFENKITWEKISGLLQNMINAEIFKDQPIYETISSLEVLKSRMDENSQEYSECKLLVESLERAQLDNIYTIWEYYSELVKQNKKQIIWEYLDIKSENEVQWLNNELSIIIKQINELPKLKNGPSESEISQFEINYKKEYKKIADDFIKLWRNKKYKKYLENSVLTTQIFIEIYSLWKDEEGIDKIFWDDVKQGIDNTINRLNSFTDVENNETEVTCDWYHNTMDVENNIEQWKAERWEEHYTDKNISFNYYSAVDNTATKYVSKRSAWYVEVTTTLHHDNYVGNWYRENHETITERSESPSPWNPEWSNEILVDHDPNGTLVWPNKDGWYAILPQELKDKSNKWQIKLAIIMGKPCVYEFMENWDIKYWIYDKEKKQLVFDKTMTQSEYSRALIIESSRTKIWEADNLEEFQTIQKKLEKITGKQKDVENLLDEWKNKDLDNIELEDLQVCSTKLYNMAECFITNPEIWENLVKMKQSLQKLNQNTNNYKNPFEEQIELRIESIDKILDFINPSNKNLEKINDFRDFCLHGIDSNNTKRKRFKEYVPMILSFIAAIAITVASYWTLSTLAVAIISAGVWLAVHEVSQTLLVSRNWTINVDWRDYSTSYQLTVAQKAYNGEITYQDAIKYYATEWWKAAALQYLLITIGGWASGKISTILAKAKPWTFCDRAGKAICNVLCKENVSKDMYTEWIISSMWKQVWKEWFLKRFWKELLEESFEESIENAAWDISPALWAVATFVHCLKPRPWFALNNAWVSYNPTINIPEWGKKLLINSTYDSTNLDNMEEIKNYYDGIEWYEVSILEWNVIKVTTKWVTYTDKLWWTTTLIDSSTEVELEFRPSKAPLSIRSMPKELLKIWWINVDDQTWNITYKSEVDLLILSEYYRQNNLWIIKINQDGTAEIITKKETIQLNKSREYFNWQSHKFNVTEWEAIYYSKKMDGYLSQIQENWENLSTILTQLREDINTEYKMVTWTDQNLDLTDEQLLSVLDAHEQDWVLWELTIWQLRKKVKILAETVTDPDIRRFLLEAWFCGKSELDIDLNEEVNQEWKNEARERLVRNQWNILEAQRALDFWAEWELWEYADIKMDITETVAKITKIRTALDTRLDGWIIEIEEWKILDTNKITTVEEFLELFQLWLNEWKTKVYDNYDKKWKKMENKSKMLLTRLYYESVYKPLWIEIFADPDTTLWEHVDRKTFIDTKHYSEWFSISELSDFWTMRQQNNGVEFKTNNEIWNKILSEIAVIEWRNKAGQPSWTTIIETVNSEIESIQDSTEHTIAVELRASIQAHSEWKISSEDQAYLFAMTMKHMWELRTAYPDLSPEKVFNLLNSNQNKLLHQHLRDLNTITSSDHGIKHVLRWNATLAENVFTNLENEWVRNKLYRKKVQSWEINAEELTLDQFKAKMKVLTRQAIIDHDLWYTNKANRAFDENWFEDSFHMVSDHPLRSTIWVEENQEFYTEIFWEDWYDAIRESLPWHWSAQTNFMDKIWQWDASTKEIVRWILSCSDCAWSPADYKIATMFAQSWTIWQLFNVFTIYRSWDVQWTIRALENLATSINNMKPNPNFDIEAFKSGVSAFLFGWGINPDWTIEFWFKEKIDNAVDIFTNKGKEWKFRKKAEENLEKKWIAKSDQNYAQLLNAEFEKLCKLEMIDKLFWFKLWKFLWAFGLQTTLDAEWNPRWRLEFRAEYDSNWNILYKQATNAKWEPIYDLNWNPVYEQKINEDWELVYDDVWNPVYEQKGKWWWSIDFELSWKSFELLAEQFWAWVALKSLIWVCDDYGINDKWPTSKFLESQIDQATKHRKHDGAKEWELINYIKQRLNPNHEALMVFNDKWEPTWESRTYKSEMEEFVNKFNEDWRKKVEKDKKNHEAPQDAEREEVQITDDLKFQQLKKQKDWSTTPVVESQITFSNDRIVISWPNNVEITLNFDGKSYEWFDETAWRFLEMNQKIDGHIKAIEDAKDNPALLYETAQAVIKDLEGYWDKVSKENPWIDVSGWKTVTQAIADIADEPVINYDELINKINEIRSTYEIKMQQVQSSNPTLNK